MFNGRIGILACPSTTKLYEVTYKYPQEKKLGMMLRGYRLFQKMEMNLREVNLFLIFV
jgi:hypothetical protein